VQEFTFSSTEWYAICPLSLSLACLCNKLDGMFSSHLYNCCMMLGGGFSVLRIYELSAHYFLQSFLILCTDKIKLVFVYTRSGRNTVDRLKKRADEKIQCSPVRYYVVLILVASIRVYFLYIVEVNIVAPTI